MVMDFFFGFVKYRSSLCMILYVFRFVCSYSRWLWFRIRNFIRSVGCYYSIFLCFDLYLKSEYVPFLCICYELLEIKFEEIFCRYDYVWTDPHNDLYLLANDKQSRITEQYKDEKVSELHILVILYNFVWI